MSPTPPAWTWRGRVDCAAARAQALAHREAILDGSAPEAIWCLEHPPVITTGRRDPGPLPSPAQLAATGTALVRTERGGLATWHGPGQLVVWPLVHIGRRRIGVRAFVALIEDTVIHWLADQGIAATRRPGAPGVWVAPDHPARFGPATGWRKLCAVGLHISRGVSVHGLALNISPSLAGFGLIVPCGITDGGVSSVAALQGTAPALEAAAEQLGTALAQAILKASKPGMGGAGERENRLSHQKALAISGGFS